MTFFTLKSSIFATLFIAIQTINTTALAQIIRNFPVNTVRGNIAFKAPPQIEVNGKAEILTPGARIRDERNALVMSGMLMGKEFTVNYKREPSTGQVHEVWFLSADELKVQLAEEKK